MDPIIIEIYEEVDSYEIAIEENLEPVTIEIIEAGIGPDGLSAYQVAVQNGFIGTEEEWLESLNGQDGEDGEDGEDGNNGASAYEVAIENGFVGTEEEWLLSLKGEPGDALTNHGDLEGLENDDHPQYFNEERGDARYSQVGHGHNISDVSGLGDALDGKVDKVAGKSLIADAEIIRLAAAPNLVSDASYVHTDANFTTTEKSKLGGIAAGATANDTDANLKARTNHTGTQDAATITGSKTSGFISDFAAAVRGVVLTGISFLTGTDVTDSDSILTAFGKLQAKWTDLFDSGTGKIKTSHLPDSILGQVSYQGLWNAATNTPAIPSASTSNKGYYYVTSVAGSLFSIDFSQGDWIISNGTSWDKVDNTDAVPTVFGRTGPISASSGDYSADQITETASRVFVTPMQKTELHTHANKTTLDLITAAFTTALKISYDSAVTWITTNGAAILAYLPSSGQKDALVGTSGTPSSSNKYVTNADSRLSDARTPTTHTHAVETSNGDSNYSIPSTTRVAITSATFTAPRTWTLPDASTVVAGEAVEVYDAFGAINGSNTLTIQRYTGQLINGVTTVVIGSAYGARRFISNGVNAWAYDQGVLRASNNLNEVTPATARTNIGAQAILTTTRSTLSVSDVNMTTAGTWYTATTMNLSAGTYIIEAHISLSGTVAAAHSYAARIYQAALGTLISGNAAIPNSGNRATTIKFGDIVTFSSSVTLTLEAVANQNSALINASTSYQGQNYATVFYAVKIA